jgi:threonine aldolase
LDEIAELCAFAHRHDLLVHVDGARIANAAAALGVTPRTLTVDAGVDVLTFGGTKNGLLLGEAICFFRPAQHAGAAPFVVKQAMQLASKMRYLGAQFEALLAGDRWLRYAAHANAMTSRLAERLRAIDGVRITRPIRCNAIFATLDARALERLQREFFFYLFGEGLLEARWMTHWATTPGDVDGFADAIARACAS